MATEEKTKMTAGTFCWADLAGKDLAPVKKFYEELLNWRLEDLDMGGGRSYTMIYLNDNDIGGMYQMDEQQLSMGLPSYWTSYVLVDDIEASTAKAKELGATVIMEPFEVGDNGVMSIIQDPTGAAFALWKDKKGGGTQNDDTGAFCWNELSTEDMSKAGEFYTKMFGWSQESMPGDMDYEVFKAGEASRAGMMTLPAQAKANGAPSHWLIYISVDECDKTVAKAKELGGMVHMPSTDFEGVGRGAVLADPTGGCFGIIQFPKG